MTLRKLECAMEDHQKTVLRFFVLEMLWLITNILMEVAPESENLFFEANEMTYGQPFQPSSVVKLVLKALSSEDLEVLEILLNLTGNACVENTQLAVFLREVGPFYQVMHQTSL